MRTLEAQSTTGDRSPRPRGVGPRTGALLAVFVAACLAVALGASNARADVEECMECHQDPALKGTRNGKEISVFVDLKTFQQTVHGDRDCIECHQDLDDTSYPHAEETAPVDCAGCHEDQGKAHAKSRHGVAGAAGDEMAPRCADCHGHHDVRSHLDPKSPTYFFNIPLTCGNCHREGSAVSRGHDIPQERIFEHYSQSIHGEGVYKKGLLRLTAVCTSCHGVHDILPHTDPASTINRKNVVATCTKCHALIERVHRKVIEGRLWEEEPGKIPVCIDCHQPHKVRDPEYPAGAANKDCMVCHGRQDLGMERDGQRVSLYVDELEYRASTHKGTACAQCHSDVDVSRTDRPCASVAKKVDCSACHAEVVTQYGEGIHGALRAKGDTDAPMCTDCHAKHGTLGKRNPSSPTFPRNVPTLCGRCHQEGQKAARRIHGEQTHIVDNYLMSIHGKGLMESGLVVTATCASCHTAHRELPPSDPRSSVHSDNVADTCGQCHDGIEAQFKKSIHWRDNVETDRKLPTCKDCHTSHSIRRTDRDDFRFLMMDQCGRCHEKEAESFFDTYHGKVSLLGGARAAKCYDCHGTHNILPPSNPASTLGRDQVVQTCGQCHEGSHRRFAGYLTHATHHDSEKYPWLFWTFWAMTALLLGTLGFALVHTLAWLFRLWISRDEWKAHKALVRAGTAGKLYRRFNRYQRMQHLIMMLSFFALALTGMALKFSYMGWAQGVRWILGGAESLGVLHRLGAVVLIGVFVTHVWSVLRLRKRDGLTWKQLLTGPDSILFNGTDLREFLASLKWFFGRGPRPRYGRYTYWEKFDYFAVFWGVFIIGTTGLVLWFPELATRVVPGWFVNVATIVHSDEALLAVGFIFTVHFFNTHFRPDKFPMDPVIFTGRVPLEELKYDKPREYEALMAGQGVQDERIVAPFPAPVERGLRIFGFCALAFGLTLIGLIVYAMLFGYR